MIRANPDHSALTMAESMNGLPVCVKLRFGFCYDIWHFLFYFILLLLPRIVGFSLVILCMWNVLVGMGLITMVH